MASPAPSLPPEPLLCPLCSLVFTDPVTTPCGHNFCHACLRDAWADHAHAGRCPACDKTFSPPPDVSVNVAFKELADAYKAAVVPQTASPLSAASPGETASPGEITCDVCAAGSVRVRAQKSCLACLTSYCAAHLEPHRKVAALQMHRLIEPAGDLQERLCARHDRLLEMFCRREQKCVCRFCVETEHRDHAAVSVEEESATRKAQIENTEADFTDMIEQRLKKAEEISNRLLQRKANAEKELERGHFLLASLVDDVRARQAEVNEAAAEEQREAEARAEVLVQGLRREVEELRAKNEELNALRDSDDHLHVLQRLPLVSARPAPSRWSEVSFPSESCVGTVRAALSKLKQTLDKQLDSLLTQELKTVQKYAVDVELDPHTAHPNIVLSQDGRQAGRGELLHVVPDNPQRFDPVICVLAKTGFTSGRFYFQVSVGSKTYWDLGVVLESVNRKGMITSKPENGFWTVRLRGGDEYRALDSPSVLLELPARPLTVGVYTDYEQGAVAFYDVDAKTLIYAFAGCGFGERVYPFFSPGVGDNGKNAAPLVVVPVTPEA
ncbi:E3 ubiquitin-protein ligase TRIM39-like [Eucyclogobius newberryi]|uniref:E3 ubiquitin-protein ligase TRIM39-like n=1 Tax=Eucyclogobius newberryi TaxID=166745 RepID=UPI003B5C8BD1